MKYSKITVEGETYIVREDENSISTFSENESNPDYQAYLKSLEAEQSTPSV
jgi:hypothetical protein